MLLQEPPVAFHHDALATWAAPRKHERPEQSLKAHPGACRDEEDILQQWGSSPLSERQDTTHPRHPNHHRRGSQALHRVASWLTSCLRVNQQLSSANLRGTACATCEPKPSFSPQVGHGWVPNPRRLAGSQLLLKARNHGSSACRWRGPPDVTANLLFAYQIWEVRLGQRKSELETAPYLLQAEHDASKQPSKVT